MRHDHRQPSFFFILVPAKRAILSIDSILWSIKVGFGSIEFIAAAHCFLSQGPGHNVSNGIDMFTINFNWLIMNDNDSIDVRKTLLLMRAGSCTIDAAALLVTRWGAFGLGLVASHIDTGPDHVSSASSVGLEGFSLRIN